MRELYSSSYSRKLNLSTPQNIVPVLIICTVCWLVSYSNSVGYPVYGEVSATPLWNSICKILPGKEVTYLIGIVLMSGGAFLLHRANYILALIREKTFLPFTLYVLFISTNPDFFPLKSITLGVFCLILAMYELFISYHEENSVGKAYNAALLIGVGSLLWVHLLWFMPLFWIGMYNFRSLSPRTLAASILGVGTVYWFLLGWCVWQNDYTMFSIPFTSLFKMRVLSLDNFAIVNWISILLIALLTVVASINIITHDYDDNLRSRQFLSFLILMAIWAFALYFIYEQNSEEFLETACVPTSILIAHFFTVGRKRILKWIFYAIVVSMVALLFYRIWNSL